MTTTLEESWELTRREFRVFQGTPFRLDHVATFWVQVPGWMSDQPNLVDSEAGKAVNEIVERHFPKLKRSGCTVEPWTVYRRDFRPIESQYRFGKANGSHCEGGSTRVHQLRGSAQAIRHRARCLSHAKGCESRLYQSDRSQHADDCDHKSAWRN